MIERDYVVVQKGAGPKPAGEWTEVTLGDVLTFSNGDSSPNRSDDMPHPVYGSNGIIGLSSNKTNTSPNVNRNW